MFWFPMQLYEIHILDNTLNFTPADHLVISKKILIVFPYKEWSHYELDVPFYVVHHC